MHSRLTQAVIVFALAFAAALQTSSAQDVWRSPRALSAEWPHLSADDCREYGAAYGYHECAGVRRKTVAAAQPRPRTILSLKTQSQHQQSAARAPLKVLQANAPAITTPPSPSKRVAAACSQEMRACFSRCAGAGQNGGACASICSTDRVCGSLIRINFAQYLDIQTELARVVRERALALASPTER
ncbi:MAG: hypothetical protein NW215_08365 [Hyphomicrobiales bacterium]|nr:hypothetical protein [Hyphomicrobiales bacterium]